MAFMMPVMKNNYDIYKDSRSRKSSECSNSSGSGAPTLSATIGMPHNDRRRKVSECKSESFTSSPSHGATAAYRMQMQRCQSQRAFPRNSSRSSAASALSPTRSFCQASSPPKTAPSAAAANTHSGSQNDLSKFHLRLVEKLRKSFRKDSAKRS